MLLNFFTVQLQLFVALKTNKQFAEKHFQDNENTPLLIKNFISI